MDKRKPYDQTIVSVLPDAIARIQHNYDIFAGGFPSYGNNATAYHLTPNKNWLAAFWSGLLWLVVAETNDPADINRAQSLLPSFVARLDDRVRLNHDLGFLFILGARANWQLTQERTAYDLALRAADELLARFRPIGGYIQAWGEAHEADEAGRFIIDCMMNLPLLFWAGRETSDMRYTEAAIQHAHTSAQYLLRPDGTTYHTYFLDAATGQPIGPKTHQGYADESVWSRGQGWAIYGFTMTAEWTGDTAFLNAAEAAAHRYLAEVKPDTIAPWDFRLPTDETVIPDSSADAIAAGGLLRLAKLTGNAAYEEAARDRITLLIRKAFDDRADAQGLFLHGTQHAPHNYGVDTYTIFGDYFALEAIMTLLDKAPDFWGPNTK